jgi:hypothetical protein
VPGLYVAGDASRRVQLAIVAAAEGAMAAFAVGSQAPDTSALLGRGGTHEKSGILSWPMLAHDRFAEGAMAAFAVNTELLREDTR